jgi:hypothetical protein
MVNTVILGQTGKANVQRQQAGSSRGKQVGIELVRYACRGRHTKVSSQA